MKGRFDKPKVAPTPQPEPETEQKPKKKKTGKILYIVILVVLLLVFLFSAGALVKYFLESKKSQETYEQVRELKGDYTHPPIPTTPDGQLDPEVSINTYDPEEPPIVTVTDPNTGEDRIVLRELAEVYKANSDLVGWLTIPGTNIDYPVVQRVKSKDYYLRRDFYGKYDTHGCLYADEDCYVEGASDPLDSCANVTIYGHRMKDQTMFAQLAKYESKSYWEENQYLYFDTLEEHHIYQIIYVFKTTASIGEGFSYHEYVHFASEDDFGRFIKGCSSNALYQTGVTASLGDKLLTLSTCDYGQENGRLVVVAKRIQ